jgi:hypothetical protein
MSLNAIVKYSKEKRRKNSKIIVEELEVYA